MNEKLSKTGIFFVTPDRKMHGTLTLDGESSVLDLSEINRSDIKPDPFGEQQTIEGILDNQQWVSLIGCTYYGWSAFGGFEGLAHHHRFFPHFAIVGGPRFNGEISRTSFVIDDAKSLFDDRKTFGDLALDAERLREVLREGGASVADDAFPFVSYWTGNLKILSVDTSIGRVCVRHVPTMTLGGGSSPPTMTNKVTVCLDVPNPVSVWELQNVLEQLLRFFGIIVGRPQNLLELEIQQEYDGHLQSSSVYLNMFRDPPEYYEYRKPHSIDILIDAAGEADGFGRLMSTWLDYDKTRNLARARFLAGWRKQRDYDADRMVGAANMFDLLPEDAVPKTSSLSDDLSSAIAKSRCLLKVIPQSEKRDSILGYLGYIAKRPSLKDKIKYRAATFVTVAIDRAVPEIDLAIDAAVELRNLYVHGNRPDEKRGRLAASIVFLTDTLEFIFGVSELVESGWELGTWYHQAFSHHPFAQYLRGYPEDLAELKRRLGK